MCQVLVLNDYREMQRMMGCECITENRGIWGLELWAGWVDGVVSWEQFLSAMQGHVITKTRGKGNLKEKLYKEISQTRLSVQSFLSVDVPGANVEIMRSYISLGPSPTDRVVLRKGYCNSIAGSFSSWASQCQGDLLRT